MKRFIAQGFGLLLVPVFVTASPHHHLTRSSMLNRPILLCALCMIFTANVSAENPKREPVPLEFQGQQWIVYADKAEVTTWKGKEALRLRANWGGMALLKDVQFSDGTIECDIAKGPYTGLVFRAADAQHGDCVYFRPQAAIGKGEGRNHTMQYCVWGNRKTEWGICAVSILICMRAMPQSQRMSGSMSGW